MGDPIDFSTYRHYNIILKTLIDSDRLDEVIRNFQSQGVDVRRVDQEELVAGFMKHNISTNDLIFKNRYDYHFTVSPVPFNMVTPPTKNTPHGHYHYSRPGIFLGDNKSDKSHRK
ncbi:unnamed protein product [Clonostachys rhizophaga]|uniref:Uncharacterized protein n=1 Tax=Clonostachys rhizophaga TaxID=160324 RepID=A0A9N9VHJ9_9HYPO|nr:unnamed protein product [Clonostachys rhizophaga]